MSYNFGGKRGLCYRLRAILGVETYRWNVTRDKTACAIECRSPDRAYMKRSVVKAGKPLSWTCRKAKRKQKRENASRPPLHLLIAFNHLFNTFHRKTIGSLVFEADNVFEQRPIKA